MAFLLVTVPPVRNLQLSVEPLVVRRVQLSLQSEAPCPAAFSIRGRAGSGHMTIRLCNTSKNLENRLSELVPGNRLYRSKSGQANIVIMTPVQRGSNIWPVCGVWQLRVPRSRCIPQRHGCQKVQSGGKWDEVAVGLIDRYIGGKPAQTSASSKVPVPAPPANSLYLGTGVATLLALNYVFFALSTFTQHPVLSMLPLFASHWHWWQFITYSFMHANFQHLANNLFMLWAFGRSIEEEEGTLGVILTYLVCAVGSGLVFTFFNPNGVLVGASGSVFGMFCVSFLLKLRLSLRKLLELAAITPFVWSQLTSNVSAQLTGAGGNIAYVAHLGGAATGLLLVAILSLLPEDEADKKVVKS